MLFREYGFRELLDKIIVFDIEETDRVLLNCFEGIDEADKFVAYCYNDHNMGISAEVLSVVKTENDKLSVLGGSSEGAVKLRYDYMAFKEAELKEAEGWVFNDYGEIICGIYRNYRVKDEVRISRYMDFFDELRYESNPDDIQIRLFNDNLKTEVVWGRIENIDFESHVFRCQILNHTYQNFGIMAGEEVSVQFKTLDDDRVIAYIDTND